MISQSSVTTAGSDQSAISSRKMLIAGCIFAGLIAVAAWQEWLFYREKITAQSAEQVLIDAKVVLQDVFREATQLYAAGVEPPDRDRRPPPFRAMRGQLNQAIARLRPMLSDESSRTNLDEFMEAIDSLQEELPEPRSDGHPPDRAEMHVHHQILNDAYYDATREYRQLSGQISSALTKAAAYRRETERRVEWGAVLFASGLLSLLAFATWRTHVLSRRSSQHLVAQLKLVEQLKASEAKYRSIFDNALEGIFQTSPDGRFITANAALARMYGYKHPEELVTRLTDIGSQLYAHPAQRQELLAALKAEDVVSNLEFEVVRADGRTIWLRENVRAVRDDSGALLYLEGTVEDVSDHWWNEQRRRLQYAVARVFNESAGLAETRQKVLQTICEILGWDTAAIWDVTRSGQRMECSDMWHAGVPNIEELQNANSSTAYSLGEGLIGEVWQTGEPRWIANLAKEPSVSNAALSIAAGMSSAFGIPIKARGEVQHVLEFLSAKITPPDIELIQTLGAISNQLGHLIERKMGEEALRASEVRKAAIVFSALDCIISYDSAGSITEFNPAAERTFGYAQSAVLGRSIDEVISPKDLRHYHREAFGLDDDVPATFGSGRRFEILAIRADGGEFPAEIALNRIELGGCPMYTAYLRDISERKAAEQVTSELAAVVANSDDSIVSCTLDGEIRSWNAGAERMFGYTADEAMGRPLHMLMPADRLDEFPQMLLAVQRGKSVSNYETVRLRKDGRKINVSVTDSPILREGGEVAGVSSIARDITERKRLEEELLQSQKMDAVGRLAGGIAHDFNNILTAILGYSDLLMGQLEERNWMWKHLNEIRKASDLAASLTHQLLAFSRRQPLFPKVFCINDSVRNIEKMLQRVIGERVRIRTEFHAEIGRVKADQAQFEQVLLNLCVNARDAMPDGGVLSISTVDVTYFLDEFISSKEMSAGEYVKLIVSDSGVGIAPEVLKHIFEPFFTTKEKGQGTGLGLATCYGIVKQSGGYINVESSVGVGTTFTVYLPRVEESGELASSRKEIGVLPGGNETILYVEDELTVRSLTAHVLRRLGYTVLEAADGKQARDAALSADGRSIDLLFTDVVLPDFNGKELTEWVQRNVGIIPVLFCSGYIDDHLLKRHGLCDESAFLQKPFTPADLARKIREVMDGISQVAQ